MGKSAATRISRSADVLPARRMSAVMPHLGRAVRRCPPGAAPSTHPAPWLTPRRSADRLLPRVRCNLKDVLSVKIRVKSEAMPNRVANRRFRRAIRFSVRVARRPSSAARAR